MIQKLLDGCIQSRKRWTGDVGEYSLVDEVATDELMREAAAHIEKLENALWLIAEGGLCRECGGEAAAEIAREALE